MTCVTFHVGDYLYCSATLDNQQLAKLKTNAQFSCAVDQHLYFHSIDPTGIFFLQFWEGVLGPFLFGKLAVQTMDLGNFRTFKVDYIFPVNTFNESHMYDYVLFF